MKLAIVGSVAKHFDERDESAALYLIQEIILKHKPDIVISGGASGIDSWAVTVAKALGIETQEFLPKKPQWEPDGFKDRNERIAQACDALVRIRHVDSTTFGSGWTFERAEALGKPVAHYQVGGIYTDALLQGQEWVPEFMRQEGPTEKDQRRDEYGRHRNGA
jgi:hypothetical protein